MSGLARSELAALDASDPLAKFRERFQLRNGLIYLDGNSLGPMPKTAPARMATAVNQEWSEGLISSWLDADWVNAPQRIGDKIAKLIGAGPGEIIATDSTSINIFKALGAAISMKPDRTVMLTEAGNFPTDGYIMQGFEAFSRGKNRAVIAPPEDVLNHLNGDVAVLLLTQVHYKTGRIRNMREVTQRAHDHGALIIWDLSHSAGSIEVDLNDANADFAVGCGYKFLNGGPGAPAYLFVAKRHHDRAQSMLSGWFGHRAPFAFTDDYDPAAGISRFLCGTPPILGLTALECGIDLFLEADMASIRGKAKRLGATFIALMQQRCGEYGFELISPLNDNERGGQVSFAHEKGYEIIQALKARDVIGDFRAPNVLRFGLTPLYVRFQDIYDAVEVIRDIMATGAWDKPEFKVRGAVT